jgi:hypothetical protein
VLKELRIAGTAAEMLIEKAETRLVEEEDAMALLEKVVTPE